MRSLPHGWRLSRHAEDQMAERAVAPSELVNLLMHPQFVKPSTAPTKQAQRGECNEWWGHGVGAVVNEATKEVVTILVDGASNQDWQEHARKHARRRHQTDAEALMALVRPETQVQDRKPAQRRTAPRAKAVETRNVLDRTTKRLYDTALKAAGGDPRRIRVCGPGKIEVLPEAS
jgi:hypothetical protein